MDFNLNKLQSFPSLSEVRLALALDDACRREEGFIECLSEDRPLRGCKLFLAENLDPIYHHLS